MLLSCIKTSKMFSTTCAFEHFSNFFISILGRMVNNIYNNHNISIKVFDSKWKESKYIPWAFVSVILTSFEVFDFARIGSNCLHLIEIGLQLLTATSFHDFYAHACIFLFVKMPIYCRLCTSTYRKTWTLALKNLGNQSCTLPIGKFFDQMEILLTNHSMISSLQIFLTSYTSGKFSGKMALKMSDRKVMISASEIRQNLGT